MGPDDHNSEVKLYDPGIKKMLGHETEHFSGSKLVVWQGRLQLNSKPQPPQLCETRVAA